MIKKNKWCFSFKDTLVNVAIRIELYDFNVWSKYSFNLVYLNIILILIAVQ